VSLICTCSSCPAHIGPAAQPPACPFYPSSSLTDAEWDLVAPLLPPPGNTGGGGGRPEKWPRRLMLDAVFYFVRGSIAWRQLPHDFPPRSTVHDFFTRMTRSGAWQRIHDCLRDRCRLLDGRNPTPTAAVIDSQTVRGADTVAGTTAGYDAGKKTKGRKRHIATDTTGLLLSVAVTSANIQDRDGAHRLLADLRARFSTITMVWADGGYAGRLVVWAATVLSLVVQIVKRTDDAKGFVLLPRRWVVERTFGWLSKHRRTIRDYERLPQNHEAIVYIAMTRTMLKRLAKQTNQPV
jgi:transposase